MISKRSNGFTLLETLTAMSIGSVLLSGFLYYWIALSKNSHDEWIKLEFSQDYGDVFNYLREYLGKNIYHPYCLNPEWLNRQGEANDALDATKVTVDYPHAITVHQSEENDGESMKSYATLFSNLDLGTYTLKVLSSSDLLEIYSLIPLTVNETHIESHDALKNSNHGYILATDCRNYIVGDYYEKNAQFHMKNETFADIQQFLMKDRAIQYYKINRELLYVVKERSEYYLVHNFLAGANFVRFHNVKKMMIESSINDDYQLFRFIFDIPTVKKQDAQKAFHVRAFNL